MKQNLAGTGAAELARALKQLGVSRVFGLCADQTNPIFCALPLEGIEVIGSRQESAAVHMADGWSRATGKPGVAIVGGGPGHVNAVTGFAVAQSAATPVIVISGQPPLHTRDRNGHQILYQADIVRTLTKWAQEITSPNIISELVSRGFRIATAGKPGPVSLSVPTNVQEGRIETSANYRVRAVNKNTENFAVTLDESITDARQAISNAERPIMIIGGGAWWDLERDSLSRLVSRTGIPAFTIEQARGLIADDGEICFGYAHPAFNRTFREVRNSDLVILVGTEFNLHTAAEQKQLLSADTRVIQLHRDAEQIGICKAADVAIVGPLKVGLEILASACDGIGSLREKHHGWLRHIRNKYSEYRNEWRSLHETNCNDASSIHPLQVCESLERYRSDRIRIVTDGGDFAHWPRIYFPARSPGHWMDGAEIGALGASLPVGIGAQIGHPAEQTWVFLGDGGFGFYGFDLSTAVQRGLPVKVFIGNDHCWGIERRLQLAHYGRTVAVDLPDIRYDRFAEILGAKGVYVEDPSKLDDAVDQVIAHDGPAVLNVSIRPACGRPLLD